MGNAHVFVRPPPKIHSTELRTHAPETGKRATHAGSRNLRAGFWVGEKGRRTGGLLKRRVGRRVTHSDSVVVFHVEVVVIVVVEGIVVAVVFVGHSGCFGSSVLLLSLLSPVVVTEYQAGASSWLGR